MKCIFIFDHLNDLIYSKCNKKFANHVKKVAKMQGLISEAKDEEEETFLSANIVMQLFSPIVTSQRIMSCQFGNSYSSVQCNDGTTMVFDEYLGYLFMHIGTDDTNTLKRNLSTCIVLVQHLCGPDVAMLKKVRGKSTLLSQLIDVWSNLKDNEQSFLVEAVEQLTVNTDLTSATVKALQEATERIKAVTERSKIHCLIFVETKFLSLYSSRGAEDLSAADILFLTLLSEVCQPVPVKENGQQSESSEETDGEFYSPQTSPSALKKLSPLPLDPGTIFNPENENNSSDILTGSHLVLLMGMPPAFSPHVVHVAPIAEGVNLLMIIQVGKSPISSGLWDGTHALSLLQSLQLQRDFIGVKQTVECLDTAVKKILDGLKKIRSLKPELERSHRQLTSSWEFLKKKYSELIKSPQDVECTLRIETCGSQFAELLSEIFRLVCLDNSALHDSIEAAIYAVKLVKFKMADFSSFLKVKALRNFTLGSRASLTINKYLEDFPGLVHFIFIDRTNHRVIAPSLDFSSEETITLTKNKIWKMVEFSRTHLLEGYTSLMWKDTTFNYAYFLWFEDSQNTAIKPKQFPVPSLKSFPLPGVLCGDFYYRLMTTCFPKVSPSKLHCYELFCIHLGLATSKCVLDQTRLLASTIWEVTGAPTNPADLL